MVPLLKEIKMWSENIRETLKDVFSEKDNYINGVWVIGI